MSAEAKDSYGRILKSSALLGGSSVINVGLGIIRTKVLAVQLGPAFFGVMGLYTSLTTMIGGVASLGLGQSAVRDIAAAAGSQDQARIARTIRVFRRTVWATGILGLLVTLALAYPASSWTFGNRDHIWAIAVLSVTVLFTEIQAGQRALLQGLRRIRDLTVANITGAIWSTLMAIAILLWLRERGVVPFLVVVAAGQLVANWWYAKRVSVAPVAITWRQTWEQSREMVSLGLAFVVSGLAGSASVYLINSIIRRSVGEAGVGLYQSAFAISGVYVNFVLQAMTGDYYPRLAGVGADVEKCNRLVNEQMEMAVLLAVPGLVAALVLSGPLILALYSSHFAGATDILRWQVLGLLGRIISWPLGFVLLARGDKAAFLWSEIAASVMHVGLVVLGVSYFGLAGAGAAFAGLYLSYSVLVYVVVRRRHGYVCQKSTESLVLLGMLIVAAGFGTTFFGGVIWRLTFGVVTLAVAAAFSLHGIGQRLGRERIIAVRQAVIGRLGLAKG
jgi:enterobacterial common antigen flippase